MWIDKLLDNRGLGRIDLLSVLLAPSVVSSQFQEFVREFFNIFLVKVFHMNHRTHFVIYGAYQRYETIFGTTPGQGHLQFSKTDFSLHTFVPLFFS